MEVVELAWFAGFFDGEGCVRIQKQPNGRYAPSYTLTVSVTNTDHATLNKFQTAFGGTIGDKRTTSNKAWWTQAWAWRLNGIAAMRFLECIRPYAVLKRPEIAIGLEFVAGVNPANSRPVPTSEVARREACYCRM
jgi:hypothetical protein